MHDANNGLRHLGPQSCYRRRRVKMMMKNLFGLGPSRKRGLSCKQVVQGAAQAVDVGSGVGRVRVGGLLGGDVIRRAHDRAFLGQGAALIIGEVVPGQAHVENLDRPSSVNDQVAGLYVPMHQGGDFMRMLQPHCRLADVMGGPDGVERAVLAEWAGEVVLLPYLHGRSTTRLVEEAMRVDRS